MGIYEKISTLVEHKFILYWIFFEMKKWFKQTESLIYIIAYKQGSSQSLDHE